MFCSKLARNFSIFPRDPHEGSRGFGVAELLVTVAIAGLLLGISTLALGRMFREHQLDAAVAAVQDQISVARLKAMKEKGDHRVQILDQGDTPANQVRIQEDDSGSYTTLTALNYELPTAVSIVTGSSSDTIDITGRGECSTGSVYLQGPDNDVRVVTILASCLARAS